MRFVNKKTNFESFTIGQIRVIFDKKHVFLLLFFLTPSFFVRKVVDQKKIMSVDIAKSPKTFLKKCDENNYFCGLEGL